MGYFIGFGGRFSRMDWWLAHLVVLAGLALTLVWFGLGVSASKLTGKALAAHVQRNGWTIMIPAILCMWIGFAATVKRYHDRDKSGWWALITLVPYIGALWQLVECGFLPGTSGGNAYGEGPGSGPSKSSSWRDDVYVDDYDYGSEAASDRLARVAAKAPAWAAKPELVAPAPREAPPRPEPVRFGRRSAA